MQEMPKILRLVVSFFFAGDAPDLRPLPAQGAGVPGVPGHLPGPSQETQVSGHQHAMMSRQSLELSGPSLSLSCLWFCLKQTILISRRRNQNYDLTA